MISYDKFNEYPINSPEKRPKRRGSKAKKVIKVYAKVIPTNRY